MVDSFLLRREKRKIQKNNLVISKQVKKMPLMDKIHHFGYRLQINPNKYTKTTIKMCPAEHCFSYKSAYLNLKKNNSIEFL